MATGVNASIAVGLTVPVMWAGFDTWRVAVLVTFFAYNVVFRARCVGCMVVGTWPNRPSSVLYNVLYTLGLSTFFYWVVVPGDLLVLNGCVQGLCLRRTGNTMHGWLAGVYTMHHTKGLRYGR